MGIIFVEIVTLYPPLKGLIIKVKFAIRTNKLVADVYKQKLFVKLSFMSDKIKPT